MNLQAFKDYVFLDQVSMVFQKGVFVGTPNYLFCAASKTVDYLPSKQITMRYTMDGKAMGEVIMNLILGSESIQALEETLLDFGKDFPEMIYYKIDELDRFKVEAGFLGSGIHVIRAGKKGWSPFVQQLGKDKKKIQEFCALHPKLKK